MSRIESIEEIEAARVDAFFNHVGVFVAHLRQAVGHVLRQRVFVRLEDEPQFRAFERRCVEVRTLRGNGDVEALAVGQDAVARVEPERVRRARLHRECEVKHVAHGPQRIFDLDVQRNHAVGIGLNLERRQIDSDAVEAAIHVFPSVRRAVAFMSICERKSAGMRM